MCSVGNEGIWLNMQSNGNEIHPIREKICLIRRPIEALKCEY